LQVNFQMQTGCGGFQCSGEIVEAIELRVPITAAIRAALDLGKAQVRAVVHCVSVRVP
jgi:hypothetical protein